MKLTWHGHAFFEMELATGARTAVDPFTAAAGNPMTGTEADDLDVEAVLVTHGHGDHFGATLDVGAPVVAIHELVQYCTAHGLDDATGTGGGMNMGGTVEVGGASVKMVPAVHSSGCPGPDAPDPFLGQGGDPAGFLIDDGETTVYHMGDTALFGDLETVVGAFHDVDLLLVPIGDVFTMGPEDAAVAVEWTGADACIPIHYDTFPPIEQDPERFAKLVAERCDADVEVPSVDEAFTF